MTTHDNLIRWYFEFPKQLRRALNNQDNRNDGGWKAGEGRRQEEQEDIGDWREENQHDRREERKPVYEVGEEAKPKAWRGGNDSARMR